MLLSSDLCAAHDTPSRLYFVYLLLHHITFPFQNTSQPPTIKNERTQFGVGLLRSQQRVSLVLKEVVATLNLCIGQHG